MKTLVALSAEALIKAILQPHGAEGASALCTTKGFSLSLLQLVLEVAGARSWPLAASPLFLRSLSHHSTVSETSSSSAPCLWEAALKALFRKSSLPPSLQGSATLPQHVLWRTGFMQLLLQRHLDYTEQRSVPGEPTRIKDLQDLLASTEEFFSPLPSCAIDLCVRRSAALSAISEHSAVCATVCGVDASESESDLAKAIPAAIPPLRLFTGLKCLCLRGVKLRHVGFSALVTTLCGSSATASIVSLNVSSCGIGVVDACSVVPTLASSCPCLRHLDVSSNPLYNAGVTAIADAFAGSKSLRSLDVTGCNSSSKGLHALAGLLGRSPSLQVVYAGANRDLYGTDGPDDIARALSAFGEGISQRSVPVVSLDLSGEEPITCARIAELNGLGKGASPPLGRPHLSGLLTPLRRLEFAGAALSALYRLCLDGVPLTQDAVAAVAGAASRGGLSSFSGSGCCLSAESIGALFDAARSGWFSALNVSGNKPVAFPVESLTAALLSPASVLARLDVGSCGLTDRHAQSVFSALATHGKSVVSLVLSANGLGPGCERSLGEMFAQNNTLTSLDLSDNNFTFAKLTETSPCCCSNQVLSKLDISYSPRAKASVLDFVSSSLVGLESLRVLRRSTGTSKLWNDSTVRLLSTHPAIEEVTISCPSLQAMRPVVEFLCGETERQGPLRLCISAGYEAALHALQNVAKMDTLTELILVCSQAHILELAKSVPRPCGTRVRLVPSFALELGFPMWSQFPLPPYPLFPSSVPGATVAVAEEQSRLSQLSVLLLPPEKKFRAESE